MKSALVNKKPKTFALIFDTGDEVMSGLKQFAEQNRLSASHFTAIGAFSDAVLGFFDVQQRAYKKNMIKEQTEVLSLVGDVVLGDSGPTVHAHVVLGKSDATAHGGHLVEAHVRPTLEVILTEAPRHLHRLPDAETGLALIHIEDHPKRNRRSTGPRRAARRLLTPGRA
jgi:predicted DNA-binding protein with PD1-like motif